MKMLIVSLTMILSTVAHASPRSGNVSFGGIQVKVTVDADAGTFQIGESKFQSLVTPLAAGRVMTSSKVVGIGVWEENLTATVYLDGGSGGDPREYNCSDIRLKIVRTNPRGELTELKNECAFLN